MTGLLDTMRSRVDRYRRVEGAVRRRPESVRGLAVLTVVHAAALAGVVWWVVVLYDVLGGGVGPGGLVTLVVLAAAVEVGWAAMVVGVWRGSDEARGALWSVGWLYVWATTALSLLAFFVPLVLTAVAGYSVRLTQQDDAVAWTAVSPAPGPGSPPH